MGRALLAPVLPILALGVAPPVLMVMVVANVIARAGIIEIAVPAGIGRTITITVAEPTIRASVAVTAIATVPAVVGVVAVSVGAVAAAVTGADAKAAVSAAAKADARGQRDRCSSKCE